MFRKRYLLLLIPVFVLAILGARLFKPVEVAALREEKDLPVQVYGLGTLEVHTLSKVGFKVPGTLVTLSFDHGDRVRRGDVLARLDSAEQESRVARALASVEKAKAAVLVAKAGEERARAGVKFKEKADWRRRSLAQERAVSAEEVDEKRSALEVAQAEVKLAEGDVASAQAALKDALAQLELEKVILSQHTLTAPYDAQVVARQKELGSVLAANEPLFTLMDPGTIWAKVHVDEELAGGLKIGQPADIRLRSAPGRIFQGRVERIDIESNRVSEERRVYLSFESLPEEPHLGEQTEAVITVANIDKGYAVPGSAIRESNGSSGLMWTISDGRLEERKVSLGYRLLDGRVQIMGDYPKGCTPVVNVPSTVRKGARAVIVQGVGN